MFKYITVLVCSFCSAGAVQSQAVADSTGNLLKGAGSIKGQAFSDAKSVAAGISDTALGAAKGLLPVAEFADLKKKLFDKNSFFKVNKLGVEFNSSYLRDTTGIALGAFRNQDVMMGYSAEAGISINNMPFTVAFKENNNAYSYSQSPLTDLYKFNFDPQKYADNLKAKVKEKLAPEAIAASTLKRINAIKDNYIQALNKDITHIKSSITDSSSLKLPADVTNIGDKDISSLQSKLLTGAALEKYKASTLQIQELLQKQDVKALEKDSVFIKATQHVQQYQALEKIYDRVLYWRKNFQENAVVKELSSHLPFTKGNFKSYLDKPENLKRTLEDHFSLNGLQQLLLNVTKLDLGQNPLQGAGQFAPQNLMNTGINTELQTSKIGAGFTYGKNNTTNNLLQGGLTNQLTNEFSSMMGLKLSRGNGRALNQSVSLNMFNFNNSAQMLNGALPGQDGFLPTPQHKDAVITLHHGFRFKGVHTIEVDFSKSLGAYVNTLSADSLPEKNDATGALLSNKGQANYAVGVEYKGRIWNSEVNAHVRNVGLGYNNPGNYLLRRGETQLGLGFTKTFLKRKLTVKYSGDYRKQDFDPSKNYSFRTIANKTQVNYRINRGNKIGLTYQRSDYLSKSPVSSTAEGANTRLQADGSYTFKWKGKTVINNTSIGKQQFNMPMFSTENIKSNAYLFSHNSSIVLKENILSLTVLSNSSDSKDYYFNTSMLSSEINYSYKVFEKVSLTSGAGYYANYGWNRQVGVSQQISTVFNKLNVDVQLGYKKAVQVIRPEFANQFVLSSTIRYNF